MTPLLPSSTSNNFVTPGNAFITSKNSIVTKCSILRKSGKQVLPSQRYTIPLSTSFRLFPQFRIGCALQPKLWTRIVAATGTDVAVGETDSPIADKDSDEVLETSPDAAETSKDTSVKSEASTTPARSKRPRAARKSDMPPIKNEDLIPGATFAGKVRSIQPFGAFVDFGAFTDGLVHVSRLTDSYVKDVTDVVSVGQEVTVRLVEANTDTGRISLTMRESDDISKLQQQKEAPVGSDKSRAPRKSTARSNQKSSKFVKGQDLEGTVKNLTRSGAFISLPEGEEGFLPASEEADEGIGNMMGGSSLEAGQEVKVRVLRISRGQVTLTMKKEEAAGELDAALSQGVIHVATNPFVLAFRTNKDISTFLDEQEKEDKPTDKSKEDAQDMNNAVNMAGSAETMDKDKDQESILPDSLQGVDGEEHSAAEEPETSSEILSPEDSSSIVDQITELHPAIDKVENGEESELSGEIADPTLLSDSVIVEERTKDQSDDPVVKEEVQSQTSVQEEKFISDAEREEEKVASTELNGGIANSSGQVDVAFSPETTRKEGEINEAVENQIENTIVADGVQAESWAAESENLSAAAVEEELKTNRDVSSSSEEDAAPEPDEAISREAESSESVQNQIDGTKAPDGEQAEIPTPESEDLSTAAVGEEEVEKNGDVSSSIEQDAAPKQMEATEDEVDEGIENQTDNRIVTDGPQAESPATVNEDSSSAAVGKEEVAPDLAKNGNVADVSVQSAGPPQKEATVKASISPVLVKELREETGAGMMDCKKALSEAGGDIVKAQEYLRKKGLASADKKASRTTAEGRIGSYIHDSRIGVLIEVNCETDFVARGVIFKELVEDLAMQVAACPQVQYVVTEDVPQETVNKEREIEMQKEDLLSKPEQIRSKIVDGRIRKRLEELALLDQPYIKNDKTVVKDWVKQTIATIGENIKVKRFVRFNLGEGLEKKSQDFAAEVTAQTTAKPAAPGKEQPAAAETKETVEKPTKATVSAALVKQLRDETGAGMMDCKKALSETGGDLEKAQEYLRKKGLSSADKKSSRLAAEGRIGSYIHDSRIGVLIEVNCETDFVGRSDKFKELVDDLAMQVVACPQVQYVAIEDIPVNIVNKEKELEMQREDLQSKPENIRERIVEGRISKRLGELALLEQPFIKDDSILVKDLVKQSVAAIGENIKVRRFVRFTLGDEQSDQKQVENPYMQ